ncbi:carboxypeptidase-like regulatory domain-containing protein [Mucilaginibacter robiniae]|uniref:Carboxypeptidase-like regulatory domain-containing protein n=1 Tax=Mucilaginibacter robiniae TaxID=2728022 RepID=A0A7L5E0H3_9SPHI|nr:hypothetical protein [Mucilaginibacter robiniae]QJD95034.1 carboxypeptidase-like regulatory domain-containing protein [Mucilaginibacter robiniae]
MKVVGILLLMVISGSLLPQDIHVTVRDNITHMPVAQATVKASFNTTLTDAEGKFSLPSFHAGDTVSITHVGYKSYRLLLTRQVFTDTIRVYLEPISVVLRPVTVKGTRNYKKDSIANRRMFASVFTYKAPTVKDMFINNAKLAYTPDNYINNPNNTTTIASVNLLQVLGFFGKKKAPVSKLQKTLIVDEQYKYVSRGFSRQRVMALTPLKGDSLDKFIDKYRPSATQIKMMTDYELMLYIKNSYTEFIKPE